MLLGLKELNKLENLLESLIEKKEIYKYRIYLNLNTTISVDIVADDNDMIKKQIGISGLVDISIDEWIDKNEYDHDEYYKKLFEKKIDKEHRRRLINLIDNSDHNKKSNVPVVTFYSYKGGVGRTTSLITFANYYAYHHKKKVVILDFDFEAPGFTNYFDFSLEELENKSGVLEYILDKEASKEPLNLVQNYLMQTSTDYAGDGSIYVMPSGNLFGQENLESYIEALARIDINSTDTITNQILDLINDISETLNPDVILIDSRTGFNDVFGFLINRISDTIVGLFEGNKQTEPGMRLFLNEIYGEEKNTINAILVNSLVHKDSGYSKRLKEFSQNVNNYLMKLTEENYAPEIFDLRKSNILGNLGTIEDDRDDYFEFIKENTPNDYQKFFDKIIEYLTTTQPKEELSIKEKSMIIEQNNFTKENTLSELKDKLLHTIDENFPKLYAEDIEYNEEYLNSEFYLRKCMEDIFNFDKFLLIGGKGTGKTAFYSALDNKEFLKNLQKKASKNQERFSVITIVSIEDKDIRDKNYFSTEIFNNSSIDDKEFFYRRFWIIYILNSILLNEDRLEGYNCSLKIASISFPQKLTNSTNNKQFFESIINDDNQMILIEKELENIDLFLKRKDKNLMITFDQLDHIVKPILWGEIISPLIKYCRNFPYLKIQPKLFLRKDLYQKLTNRTNKNALDTRIIKLEWSKDEVFAFFFKIVFAYGKDTFFEIMKKYDDISKERIDAIHKKINRPHSYNQIGLDKYDIASLVETFFGKYPYPPNIYKRDILSYDWFYNNLADANSSISLRPFLDLIKFSIERAFKNTNEHYEKPILGAFFYTNQEVRTMCVKRHFEDLADEEGNEDLQIIIEHIHASSSFPDNLRYRSLKPENYDKFLDYFLTNKDMLKLISRTAKEIEDILTINGVVSIEYRKGSKKQCTFAYLYKYYLGLKG